MLVNVSLKKNPTTFVWVCSGEQIPVGIVICLVCVNVFAVVKAESKLKLS